MDDESNKLIRELHSRLHDLELEFAKFKVEHSQLYFFARIALVGILAWVGARFMGLIG